MTDTLLTFPKNFTWGVSTSAYQIEGAWNEEGRGLSIWDTFSHQPGRTHRNDNGDTAADHYHRWIEDVGLMAEMGVKAYRFSIAWPRILPDGRGAVNPGGLDFYDRLVDTLLEKGIQPYPTLYHWDLPQALQDAGGWPNRDTARYFAEYAFIVGQRLGNRLTHWITHNEPFVAAVSGHFIGDHAPGIQDPMATFATGHHLMLSHGLAVQALRASTRGPLEIGIALNLSPIHPASESEPDRRAAALYDGILNRLFLDPILHARYPEDVVSTLGFLLPPMEPDDLKTIAEPIDFLGVNYYSRSVVQYDENFPLIQATPVLPPGNEYSQMWEVYPEGLYEILMRLHREYAPPNLLVTENGICVPDGVDFDGGVRDERRIRYLSRHIAQVQRALSHGAPVRGYFVWSLLDNFEWAFGYQMRFGLVHVDFESKKRTMKHSGRWYRDVIRHNGPMIDRTASHPL
jgi:beta-glucosidase